MENNEETSNTPPHVGRLCLEITLRVATVLLENQLTLATQSYIPSLPSLSSPTHAPLKLLKHTGPIDDRSMTDPLSLPQSGEEALQQLLARGLSQDSPDNPASYCRLLQVLFDHCILKPLTKTEETSPTTIEQVDLTLTILQRQTTARPELLSSPVNVDDVTGTPLYQWILPRIIYAAVRYEDQQANKNDKEVKGQLSQLVESLLQAAARMISVLCRDLEGDGTTTYAKGVMKASLVLSQLLSFSESECLLPRRELTTGISQRKTTVLYDFPDLPSTELSMLFSLDIVLRTQAYYNDDTTLEASRVLATAVHTFRSASLARQTRYAITLTHALESDAYSPMLRKACVSISKWPVPSENGLGLDSWRSAMSKLFEAIGKADADTRAEVWWTIIDDIDAIDFSDGQSCRRAVHILTPIPDRMSRDQIKSVVPAETVNGWRETLLHPNSQGQTLVRACLDKLDANDIGSCRKRKRDAEKDEEVLRSLKKELPELDIPNCGEILPALNKHIRRYGHNLVTLSSMWLTLQNPTRRSRSIRAGCQSVPVHPPSSGGGERQDRRLASGGSVSPRSPDGAAQRRYESLACGSRPIRPGRPERTGHSASTARSEGRPCQIMGCVQIG